MLGVAVLLASSSMAAIELITLYARLDSAVHKMAPPTHRSPPISPCVCSALATEKTCALLLKNLNLRVSSLFFLSLGPSLCTPNNDEMLLLCSATGV